ncbi:UvrD-helicase domain-containing protein [Paraburkholderia atlantica]|uniref:UvrD-helicase domain-containing protein n=1 Tax=Paraburkholderia atlantica TaxID=2654982 RepID=UPI0035D503D6
MAAVGAIDDVGIVSALCARLDALAQEFDHVLVDEVQDLGTLELRIIRRLTRPGANDLFLCGDAAQTVHTKYLNMKDAEIDLPTHRDRRRPTAHFHLDRAGRSRYGWWRSELQRNKFGRRHIG